ncbi:protein kinase [Streptomyces sp. NPDC048629]|uniref:serine/threonine-protein kinase n=1 Tax=Streptomyces sp. NPDC048629 TaxID=3154824 RepID=UPI0034438353
MLGALHEGAPRAIGPYRVVARLGAGGMGEVYLGADERTPAVRTFVALKTVLPGLAGEPGFRARFRREIETGRAVVGRYTVDVLDGDHEAVRPWLATAYVPGPTLEQAVRDHGPLPEASVARLGRDLVRALRSIHHARILHRDLKPANILLTDAGPKVIDFGIARAFGASRLTGTGMMVGSPGFMSPEHIAGAEHVAAASDVFCLGAVLCYAATGRGPFGEGPLPAVLYRIARADADLTVLPTGLRDLAADCLRLDPSARPDTAELDRRFEAAVAAASAGATPADAAGDPLWPAPLARAIAERVGELAALDARLGPPSVHPRTETGGREPGPHAPGPHAPGPHAPGGQVPGGLHDAATMAAPARDAQVRDASRHRRRTRIAAAVATLVVLSGTLVAARLSGLWPGAEQGGGPSNAGPTAPGSVPPGAGLPRTVTSLDALGSADRNRSFDASPSQRPAGWKPWTARLPAGPTACAADPATLACRLGDGSLQAVAPSDGRLLWRAPLGKGSTRDATTGPVVAGDVVVSVEDGHVRARAVGDGAVRWDTPFAGKPVGRLLGVDRHVFVNRADRTGVHVDAYDLASGKRRWTEAVSTAPTGGGKEAERYGAKAYGLNHLLVNGERGLTAHDPATGRTVLTAPAATPLGGAGTTKACPDPRISSGQLFCPDPDGKGMHVRVLRDLTQLETFGDIVRVPRTAAPGRVVFGPVHSRTMLVALPADGRVVWVGNSQTDGKPGGTAGTVPRARDGSPAAVGAPVLLGSVSAYADNASLYLRPARPEDGPLKVVPVKGAPGNVSSGQRPPELLSVGDVVLLAYADGTMHSLALPPGGE